MLTILKIISSSKIFYQKKLMGNDFTNHLTINQNNALNTGYGIGGKINMDIRFAISSELI